MAQKRRSTRTPAGTPPPQPPALYTYQGGQKVALDKAPGEFVVRANPDTIRQLGYQGAESMSPSSYRVSISGLWPRTLNLTSSGLNGNL